MSEVIVLVTGGFDPIHSGHIAYLKDAKKLGDKLIVGVNSDQWLVQKKGSPFLPIEERIEIVSNLSVVDKAIEFTDDELNSASGAIQKVIDQYPDNKIIFANGGDRTSDNIPEMEKFKNNKNVEFKFGVGGDFKKNSSSWILKNWNGTKEMRPWGWFRVIDDSDDHKVKEIQVNPKSRLSLQSHSKRSEVWTVIKGEALVTIDSETFLLKKNESAFIPAESTHRLENQLEKPLSIIEIQTGSYFGEDDIKRYEDDYNRS
jgi:cytidyltransferase-like protein